MQQLEEEHSSTPATRPLGRSRLREVIAAIDPSLPSFGAMTMEQAVANGFSASRSGVAVASFFGFLALLIASIGLYAVVARSVAERTREMGVRTALGLTPRGVMADLMRDGARLGLIGLVFGSPAGWRLPARWQACSSVYRLPIRSRSP